MTSSIITKAQLDLKLQFFALGIVTESPERGTSEDLKWIARPL